MHFCRWPSWKNNARVEVYDPNLKLVGYKSKRLIIFYRGDQDELKMLFKSGDVERTKTISGVTPKDLTEIKTFKEVWEDGLAAGAGQH